MGFYVRKSVRVGPLRFNLSKSGVGVSAGIPGFRIGMGPRGNYIHAGRGGFYYRATIPTVRHDRAVQQPPRPRPSANPNARITLGPEVPIDSGSVLEMREESAAGLLAELNEKRARWRLAPLVLIGGVMIIAATWDRLTSVGQIAIVFVTALLTLGAVVWDALRKTTVMLYDLDADAAQSYQGLIDAVQALGQAQRLWHVSSRAVVLDRKYHAGAQSEIKRARTATRLGGMPFVKCNIAVPSLGVGRQTMFFLPDRMLVFDSGSVGAVSYSSLQISRQTTRFIEAEGVPSDSRVVGRTWRFVNKGGGPDRRFNNNREIPICEYEAIQFRSASGLNELIHASRVGVADALIRYLSIEAPRLEASPSPRAMR